MDAIDQPHGSFHGRATKPYDSVMREEGADAPGVVFGVEATVLDDGNDQLPSKLRVVGVLAEVVLLVDLRLVREVELGDEVFHVVPTLGRVPFLGPSPDGITEGTADKTALELVESGDGSFVGHRLDLFHCAHGNL